MVSQSNLWCPAKLNHSYHSNVRVVKKWKLLNQTTLFQRSKHQALLEVKTAAVIIVIHTRCKANNGPPKDPAGDCTPCKCGVYVFRAVWMRSTTSKKPHTCRHTHTKQWHSCSSSMFCSVTWYFLREISAAIRMSFQMVIKLLLVSLCGCVCFPASPTLYIITSPIEAEDGGGGKLLSEELHKYSGYRRGSMLVTRIQMHTQRTCTHRSTCTHRHTI